MTDTGVHLIQLSRECIKASIYALKLRHNHLKGHTTCRRKRSGCGSSRKSWRSHCLSPWLLQSKLGLALSNGHRINGTHYSEVRRFEIGDRCVAKNLCDNRRENKLITGRRILIDIYKGEYEVRRKVNSESLK